MIDQFSQKWAKRRIAIRTSGFEVGEDTVAERNLRGTDEALGDFAGLLPAEETMTGTLPARARVVDLRRRLPADSVAGSSTSPSCVRSTQKCVGTQRSHTHFIPATKQELRDWYL